VTPTSTREVRLLDIDGEVHAGRLHVLERTIGSKESSTSATPKPVREP